MNKIDWDSAPKWADRLVALGSDKSHAWADCDRYMYVGNREEYHFRSELRQYETRSFLNTELIEMRPESEPLVGDRLIDKSYVFGTSCSPSYEISKPTAPKRSSQPHYKDDKDGLDHIARFARDNSIEEFRAAMRFTIDKYRDRLGEKDARSKELGKIADYYGRWAEVELELEKS